MQGTRVSRSLKVSHIPLAMSLASFPRGSKRAAVEAAHTEGLNKEFSSSCPSCRYAGVI